MTRPERELFYLDAADQAALIAETAKYHAEIEQEKAKAPQKELERRAQAEYDLAVEQLDTAKWSEWYSKKFEENARIIFEEFRIKLEMAKNCANLTLTENPDGSGSISGTIPKRVFKNPGSTDIKPVNVSVTYDITSLTARYDDCRVDYPNATYNDINTVIGYHSILTLRNTIRDQIGSGKQTSWKPSTPKASRWRTYRPGKA